MRIWDVSAGYLNRQSLLGEHRELHGLASILLNNKKGYSRHPETLRWVGYGWALKKRHSIISAEMSLRGYADKTPVLMRSNKGIWPCVEIDDPSEQLRILSKKYLHKEEGRIALPQTSQQLWSQHKYSILARDIHLYKQIGSQVSTMKPGADFSELTNHLSNCLKSAPTEGGIRNALLHMWGYISDQSVIDKTTVNSVSLSLLLSEIQRCSVALKQPYLINSTALSELAAWI